MKKSTEKQIINESRHQFIYGYNNEKRHDAIKNLLSSYPIAINQDAPIIVHIDDFDLKSKKEFVLDKTVASRISAEHIRFLVAYELLNRALKENALEEIPERADKFLETVNRIFVTSEEKQLSSLEELVGALKLACDFYSEQYQKVVDTGAQVTGLNELPISFLSLQTFIKYFKKMINNNSYVAVLLDVSEPISLMVTQSVNDYISRRCNSDISIKVVCEPHDWTSYYDQSGFPIEHVHDYGIVELDSSHSDDLERIKRKWQL